MSPLLGAIVPALALLAAPAEKIYSTTPEPFKTTREYVAYCSDATLRDACSDGYEAALVQLIMSKKLACAPSQSASQSNDTYEAAKAAEIPKYVEWLRKHPQHMSQDFRIGLGSAIIAIYGCS
jgi:hypothetical protein